MVMGGVIVGLGRKRGEEGRWFEVGVTPGFS